MRRRRTYVCQFLYAPLQVAPYAPTLHDPLEEDWNASDGISVLAFSYVDNLFLDVCFLTRAGVPVDTFRLKNMMRCSQFLDEDEFEKKVRKHFEFVKLGT